jgi:hypothetical protein
MLSYIPNKYECLYLSVLSIKKQDNMSEIGHIVHTSNFTTVERAYRRKKIA